MSFRVSESPDPIQPRKINKPNQQQNPADIKIDFSEQSEKNSSVANNEQPTISKNITKKDNGDVVIEEYLNGKLDISITKNKQGEMISFNWMNSNGKKSFAFNYDKNSESYTHSSHLLNGKMFNKISLENGEIKNEIHKDYNKKTVVQDGEFEITTYEHDKKAGAIQEFRNKNGKLVRVIAFLPCEDGANSKTIDTIFDTKTGACTHVIYNNGSPVNELSIDEKNKITFTQNVVKDFIEINKRYDKERRPIIDSSQTLPFNGKFDKPIVQSAKTGNCFVLSPLISMNSNPKTQAILEKSLRVNEENGDITVTFKNGKSYTFKQDDIRQNPLFSNGDPDVKALEVAIEQEIGSTQNGGISDPVYKLFLPKAEVYGPSLRKDMNLNGLPVDNKLIDTFNNKNKVFSVGFNKIELAQISDDGTKKDILTTGHVYAIKGSDDKHVYIINPHDSSKTIKITRELFLANAANVVSADVPM